MIDLQHLEQYRENNRIEAKFAAFLQACGIRQRRRNDSFR